MSDDDFGARVAQGLLGDWTERFRVGDGFDDFDYYHESGESEDASEFTLPSDDSEDEDMVHVLFGRATATNTTSSNASASGATAASILATLATRQPGAGSSTSASAPSRKIGGHDLDFVQEPDEQYVCPVCLLVLRDPHLTGCCGHHYCQSCVQRLKRDKTPCPLCKEADFHTFLDKFILRKINELKVKCPKQNLGCLWQGELGTLEKHLDPVHGDCTADVPCKYDCGRKFPVGSLDDHYRTCDKRPYTCGHCLGFSSTYAEVTGVHCLTCPRYPIRCPNGCLAMIQRRNIQKHNSKCPLAVHCRYEFAGCTTKLGQSAMDQHLQENTAQHLGMVEEAYRRLKLASEDDTKLKDEIRSKDEEIGKLNDQLIEKDIELRLKARELIRSRLYASTLEERLESQNDTESEEDESDSDLPTTLPKHFVMSNFSDLQSSQEKWYSPSFHSEGYKLCLSVYPNGVGIGKYTHLSVFVNVMQGGFDDRVSWPFDGEVAVQLQDRSGSKAHYRRVISFKSRSARLKAKRVTSKELNVFGHGDPCFIELEDLKPDYLIGDALYFMVLTT